MRGNDLKTEDDLWVDAFVLLNEFLRDKSIIKPIKNYKTLQDVIDELKTKYEIKEKKWKT